MHRQPESRQQRFAREMSVQRYLSALDRGDMDSIIAILREAEGDPILEGMVLEAHDIYLQENQEAPQPGQVAAARYKLLNQLSELEETGILPSRPPARPRRRWVLIQTAVAIIIVCALIGSALLLLMPHQTHTGSHGPALGTWKLVTSPNPGSANNELRAIAVVNANDAWAVGSSSNVPYPGEGEKMLIEHWNGFAWSVVKGHNAQLANSVLNGVAALSPDNVWVIGGTSHNNFNTSQPLVEHWNGKDWSIVNISAPANSFLIAIAAVSPDDMWVTGGYEVKVSGVNVQRVLIEHWDGRSWKTAQAPNVFTAGPGFTYLAGITAASANDVWAVGFSSSLTVQNNQTTLIEHWNGRAWTVAQGASAGIHGFLYGIAAVSSDDIWAVGTLNTNSLGASTQQALIEHWNGSSWSVVVNPVPTDESSVLDGVAARSATDIWVAGTIGDSQPQTLIEHWDGHAWKIVSSPSIGTSSSDAPRISNQLNSIAIVPSSTTIWAVGIAQNLDVAASPPPTPTQFSPVTSQTLIVSYGG